MNCLFSLLFAAVFLFSLTCSAQKAKPPIMGWSSWDHFRVNINEEMIREQADAPMASGMFAAGYRFINIDDGYFGGRDAGGKLFSNAKKFPSGMKALAICIHRKGLKAGLYTNAGKHTCGSIYDKDSLGAGAGVFGHVEEDRNTFFNAWSFDCLKVDWCGGEKLKLKKETGYTKIISAVKAINSAIVFNVCRSKFPGDWVVTKADSWRISGDIRENFPSILKITDLNANLYKYCFPGHYNDIDMLQVVQGMSDDEAKTHFSMWYRLNPPLLAGNVLRQLSQQTIDILTSKVITAVNQDPVFAQGRRLFAKIGAEVWMKPLRS